MWRPGNKVALAISLLVGLATVGTVGYRIIEGLSWFDSLYMTLITLATIGYNEPENFSDAGRYFTVILIVGGVGTVGYAASLLTQAAVHGELLATWEKRRVQERLKQLKDHFIVCGAGRVGVRVAQGLAAEGLDFVVVESGKEKAEHMAAEGWLVVFGDATHEDVLEHAGIERARGLVCALPTDADNVFIVLTARDLCSRIHIVARVNSETAIPKMLKAGADKVISPLRTGANQMVHALLRPSVAKFFEFAGDAEKLNLAIDEATVVEGSIFSDRSLRDANVRSVVDVIIVAVLTAAGEMIFNPNAETVVHPGDKIIAIGNKASVDKLAALAAARPIGTVP